MGRRVANGRADAGVMPGGCGQGEVIVCDKIRGVRWRPARPPSVHGGDLARQQ
ncbi:hypothetical protein ABZS81_31430 [Streptomyces sp. NPDC005318]|uniref:hypothetical protein n=1 Tax=Streptomyces sp. NPDC005318 TaxID=3157031 RepID=UPI0033AB409E